MSHALSKDELVGSRGQSYQVLLGNKQTNKVAEYPAKTLTGALKLEYRRLQPRNLTLWQLF